MKKTRATIAAIVLATGTLAAQRLPGLASAPLTLSETGSTLMYPLFREWAAAYRKAVPNVRLTTAGTGSTAGVAAAISGSAQIGASDAYMSDEEVDKNPSIINIPLAISAQTINANLPGLAQAKLRLSGPAIADIYLGRVTQWDDKEIADLNPGLKLPHHSIVPIHRSDGSGDTFMFTQFLTFSDKTWDDGPNYGTTLDWPAVPGAVKRRREPRHDRGGQSPSVFDRVRRHELRARDPRGRSRDGRTSESRWQFRATHARDGTRRGVGPRSALTPKDERLTLVFAPGANSYPIVSYEYAVVSTKQPSAATAAALRDFLTWVIDARGGNAPEALEPLNFIPLPEFVRALSLDQIANIQS